MMLLQFASLPAAAGTSPGSSESNVPEALISQPVFSIPNGTSLNFNANTNYRLFVDGREVGCWTNVDLQLLLGSHVVMVEPVTTHPNTVPTANFNPEWGVGAWIWDHKTFDKQAVRFWRSFVIPQGVGVVQASLRMTVDNSYRVLLDGREIGLGSDLHLLSEYDLTWLLKSGTHVLAVEAFNDDKEAGLLAGLKIDLTDGRTILIPSDTSWRIVPNGERGWENKHQPLPQWPQAMVVGGFMESPWANVPGVVHLPPLKPIPIPLWDTRWFQSLAFSIFCITLLVCVQLMIRLAIHSKSQSMLCLERMRIARDIHDELGSGLTQLLLLGEVVRKDTPPDTQTGIARLCAKARGLSIAIDEIIWEVNSRHDTLPDFARHACKYAQAFLAATGICCRLDVESQIPSLPFDLPVRRNLFLAVKEILNNAAKHSGAHELFLRIHRHGGEVVVQVEDDGRGFDPTMVSAERNGLNNLRERMAEIGGVCEVISQPGAGCQVALRVPMSQSHPQLIKWFSRAQRLITTRPREPKLERIASASPPLKRTEAVKP